jgi:hypothetical protein
MLDNRCLMCNRGDTEDQLTDVRHQVASVVRKGKFGDNPRGPLLPRLFTVDASHSLTISSLDPDATVLPFSEKDTAETMLPCPTSVRAFSPVTASHSLTVLSSVLCYVALYQDTKGKVQPSTNLRPACIDIACAQCFISRVTIHARKVLFTNGTSAMAGLLPYLLKVVCLQWAKHANVVGSQFVRFMRE